VPFLWTFGGVGFNRNIMDGDASHRRRRVGVAFHCSKDFTTQGYTVKVDTSACMLVKDTLYMYVGNETDIL
jgi:hypothetical protein